MDQLSVGIVGFGRIGSEHAGWLSRARGIRAIAAADATPARREMAANRGLRVFEDIDSMLRDAGVDLVLIATPTAMHFEHAMAALRAGKHVMIEKPMALDLVQAKQIVDEAIRRGRVLSVFQNRRWDIDYLTVLESVRRGIFGKIINVESRLHQWNSCVGPAAREYHPNWRNEAAFGGGGLYDWGSHFIDQLWRLMLPAKPVLMFAQLRGNVWTSDCDDFARVCIDFDNGAVGMVEINTTTTRPLPRWHIDGTAGSADSPYSFAFDTTVWADLQFTPAGSSTPRRIPRAVPGFNETQIWESFAAAICDSAPLAVPAAGVLPTMLLLDAARESNRCGRSVTISDFSPRE